MTTLAKAVAFAERCLKWLDVTGDYSGLHTFIWDAERVNGLDLDSADGLQEALQEFLGKKYFIQINRGTSSLFHWRVIVGVQDRSAKGACLDNAQAEGEDLWDCIFDACMGASMMFEPAAT